MWRKKGERERELRGDERVCGVGRKGELVHVLYLVRGSLILHSGFVNFGPFILILIIEHLIFLSVMSIH